MQNQSWPSYRHTGWFAARFERNKFMARKKVKTWVEGLCRIGDLGILYTRKQKAAIRTLSFQAKIW